MPDNPQKLVITRVFDAPRELVWKAWTEGEYLKQWSCPKGFTITLGHTDLRVGGACGFTMHATDGQSHTMTGKYLQITPPERLSFTHAWVHEKGNSKETIVTVVLVAQGNKTQMTFTQEGFDSVESRDGHRGGWNQSFDTLADNLLTF